ncbi:MAG TPA: ribosome maturation factor RimP [Verrucomicrobiae bacterium]|nr:ribosome maturation factor RimP [Verrucomicrobiae bacterium]
MKSRVEAQVATLVEPYIEAQGLELVDVEYVKEGAHWYLRIFIDKEGGIDLNDCQEISHIVSEKLDQADPISQAYMLEVSSPGLERPLKKAEDFARFKGKLVTVHTYAPFQGFKEFTGFLLGLENEQISLEFEGQQIAIPTEQVSKTHLAIEF